jgi:NAD dependent epimerase/dehydratase family enzyme
VNDIAGAILHIIRSDSLHGPVNLVAPNSVRNGEFTHTLAAELSRPAVLSVPTFVARLAMGEMADELLLASQRVKPAKLLASGYSFQRPELKHTLRELLH